MNLNFQEIIDKLLNILPVEWKDLIFMAEYTSGSYGMRCYVSFVDTGYKDIMEIEGTSKVQIVKTYKSINNDFQKCRAELEKDKCWHAVTIILDRSGKFEADFDYDSHEEKVLDYLKNWEKKYIGR